MLTFAVDASWSRWRILEARLRWRQRAPVVRRECPCGPQRANRPVLVMKVFETKLVPRAPFGHQLQRASSKKMRKVPRKRAALGACVPTRRKKAHPPRRSARLAVLRTSVAAGEHPRGNVGKIGTRTNCRKIVANRHSESAGLLAGLSPCVIRLIAPPHFYMLGSSRVAG